MSEIEEEVIVYFMIDIGLGTTGKCNMNCRHCYSRKYDGQTLTYEDVKKIVENININSVNFGTGENILNPEFKDIVELFHGQNIKMSLTSNGFSILNMEDIYLKWFNDIDISLEYPVEQLQNDFRGSGSWDMAVSALSKCNRLKVPVSIACTLMNANKDYIDGFAPILERYDCYLRVNIIKTSKSMENESLAISYSSFWKSIQKLVETYKIVSCSEPIVCAALGVKKNDKGGSPCGNNSIRIQPDRSILPCVYWGDTNVTIEELFNKEDSHLKVIFSDVHKVPEECIQCSYVDVCQGGCASRRYLRGEINRADPYCPIVKRESFPVLFPQWADQRIDLVHSSYLCTIILSSK